MQPQTYGIGIKELWEIDPAKHKPGLVIHTAGWPLDRDTYGGSFLYHLENNQVAVGFVIGLDYENPLAVPFDEFQRFKTHPAIRPFFEGGRRISYGARAINEGGLQSLPKLTFPGGVLIGCEAGTLNMPKIKGTPYGDEVRHARGRGGVRGAQAAARSHDELNSLSPTRSRKSWVWDELHAARNVRAVRSSGACSAARSYTGIDQILFRGKAPWTLKHAHARQ